MYTITKNINNTTTDKIVTQIEDYHDTISYIIATTTKTRIVVMSILNNAINNPNIPRTLTDNLDITYTK